MIVATVEDVTYIICKLVDKTMRAWALDTYEELPPELFPFTQTVSSPISLCPDSRERIKTSRYFLIILPMSLKISGLFQNTGGLKSFLWSLK